MDKEVTDRWVSRELHSELIGVHNQTVRALRAQEWALPQLQRLVLKLAEKANGGPFEDAETSPTIRFSPAIADYGVWVCYVDIDFTNEGKGQGRSHFIGSLDSNIDTMRRELRKRE